MKLHHLAVLIATFVLLVTTRRDRVFAVINRNSRCGRVHNFSSRDSARLRQNSELARSAEADKRELLVIGVYIAYHDSSIAATLGGRALGVVELERLWKLRFFDPTDEIFNNDGHREGSEFDTFASLKKYVAPALEHLCELARPHIKGIHGTHCQLRFDVAAVEGCGANWQLFGMLRRLIKAEEWVIVDHHHAHAALGYFDSPFYNLPGKHHATFIISYDGAGNDGQLRTFVAYGGRTEIAPRSENRFNKISLGYLYLDVASSVRDFSWGEPYGSVQPCSAMSPTSRSRCRLAFAGSFMAFAALGTSKTEWRKGAQLLLNRGIWDTELWPSPHGGFCQLSLVWREFGTPLASQETELKPWRRTKSASSLRYFSCDGVDEEENARELDRCFAATFQGEFEQVVLKEVHSRVNESGQQITSLVISGGCALNIKVNSILARGLNLPTHVPPAPGDHGLSLGAAWLVMPPPRTGDLISGIHFAGMPLVQNRSILDAGMLAAWSEQFNAVKLIDVSWLADMLLNGAIVGVARGNSEFGPRALGHRSFLAAAHDAGMKDRLNRLKQRQWYRPCSPIIASEDIEKVFSPGLDLSFGSPYMSFAPPLQEWATTALPALAHIDGTARPNGVRYADDAWMYSLLEAVRDKYMSGGRLPIPVGVLINTSLNGKGLPIAADIQDILKLFCKPEGSELNYVLIEDWLFERDAVIAQGVCRT